MGEYAIRKSDGAEVKIGTCEDMLYLRFEDAAKVQPMAGNVDPVAEAHQLRFRLPFPDEDDVQLGSYKEPFRGLRLHQGNQWFSDPTKINDPGTMQVHHTESGLLINVPCYHGEKLPNVGECKVFWNGKGPAFELFQIRAARIDGTLHLFPVIRCRFCRNIWRYTWEEVLPFVSDYQMLLRLREYARA